MTNEDQWQRIVHSYYDTCIELIGYHTNFEAVAKRALTQTIMADSKPGCYDYEGEP